MSSYYPPNQDAPLADAQREAAAIAARWRELEEQAYRQSKTEDSDESV